MSAVRVLHVDDEPDIREVVEVSLGLDPDFVTRSCGSGSEALTVAADWSPDIILLDVMMPVMDGPATLARLRDNARTAAIPVVFMTARAQTREIELFIQKRIAARDAGEQVKRPVDAALVKANSRRAQARKAGMRS